MRTTELTWGEHLAVMVERHHRATGEKQTPLFERVADVLGCSVNAVRGLLDHDEAPQKRNAAERAYVLCLALGLDPADWNLSDDVLSLPLRRIGQTGIVEGLTSERNRPLAA